MSSFFDGMDEEQIINGMHRIHKHIARLDNLLQEGFSLTRAQNILADEIAAEDRREGGEFSKWIWRAR